MPYFKRFCSFLFFKQLHNWGIVTFDAYLNGLVILNWIHCMNTVSNELRNYSDLLGKVFKIVNKKFMNKMSLKRKIMYNFVIYLFLILLLMLPSIMLYLNLLKEKKTRNLFQIYQNDSGDQKLWHEKEQTNKNCLKFNFEYTHIRFMFPIWMNGLHVACFAIPCTPRVIIQ